MKMKNNFWSQFKIRHNVSSVDDGHILGDDQIKSKKQICNSHVKARLRSGRSTDRTTSQIFHQMYKCEVTGWHLHSLANMMMRGSLVAGSGRRRSKMDFGQYSYNFLID